ncbi:MAG: hypothetical protein ACFCU1_12205 [Sumerlaeia bacterium]
MINSFFSAPSLLAVGLGVVLPLSLPAPLAAQGTGPQVTFHWHMHQPIYWNDQKSPQEDRYEYAWESIMAKNAGRVNPLNDLNEIFGKPDRVGAYQRVMRDSLANIGGGHPNSGVVTSYSGALMENVRSLGNANQLGYSPNWKSGIAEANGWTTSTGASRLEITNFSFHHALLALHNEETVRMELLLMQEMIRQEFGPQAISKGVFPTEMCFSTRLIPTFVDLGIEWTIVPSEHIARATPDFPITFGGGGMNNDPPNKADQINPPGVDFITVSIDRGCSVTTANPLSYRPAYVQYVDPVTGEIDRMIAVPADNAQGWNDGYSCLSANSFMPAINAKNDPQFPSLVLLSHDGDNAFGGGNSYYFECVPGMAGSVAANGGGMTSVQHYLNQFPPAQDNVIHVTDGGWPYADSDFGSHSFINWNYPLLNAQGQIDPVNGWHEKPRDMAIFTETLNRVLTAQQISGHDPILTEILNPTASTHPVDRAWHYHLGSTDSGNVYFGPALDLEIKATIGANEAVEHTDPIIGDASHDLTPPTIWLPQRQPYNPGGVNFGVQYGYKQFIDDGDFHIWTFIADVSGPVEAVLKYRIDHDGTNPLSSTQNETFAGGDEVGEWVSLPMNGRTFPKENIYNNPNIDFFELPTHISDHYSVEVKDLRNVLIDYYVEATDAKGNRSTSPIQHVWIGDGQGSTDTGGGGSGARLSVEPDPLVRGETATVTYNAVGSPLNDANQVYIHWGKNEWQSIPSPRPALSRADANTSWTVDLLIPQDAETVQMVFTTEAVGGNGIWDNNGGADWRFTTTGGPIIVVPDPTANPFVMDGQIDDGCTVEGALSLAEENGWLYVAIPLVAGQDAFIYLMDNPLPGRIANWDKSGNVGSFDMFLASESANDFASWFDSTVSVVADDPARFVKFKGNGILEGAIRRSEVGASSVYVAVGYYGTHGGDGLINQIPAGNSDGNIDETEHLFWPVGALPCDTGTGSSKSMYMFY